MAGPDKHKIINIDITRDKKNIKEKQELQFNEPTKKKKSPEFSRTQKKPEQAAQKSSQNNKAYNQAQRKPAQQLKTDNIRPVDETTIIAFQRSLNEEDRKKIKAKPSGAKQSINADKVSTSDGSANRKKKIEGPNRSSARGELSMAKKGTGKLNTARKHKRPDNALSNEEKPQNKKNRRKKVKKAKKMNKAKIKRIAIFVLTLLFISMIVFAAYWFVRADSINVSGNKEISAEDIIALSGLSKGDHFFTIDRAAVEKGIEASPRLEFLGIDFKLPGELTIKVKERIPAAQFKIEDGSYIVIDKEGTAVDDPAVLQELPMVSGLMVTKYSLSYAVRVDDSSKLENLKLLLDELEAHYLIDDISDIDLKSMTSVSLKSTSGMEIYIGSIGASDELCRKITWVQSVLPELQKSGYEKGKLNVTSEKQATYEPEKGQDSKDAEVILSQIGQAVEPQH